jgi:hypothetical protein
VAHDNTTLILTRDERRAVMRALSEWIIDTRKRIYGRNGDHPSLTHDIGVLDGVVDRIEVGAVDSRLSP